MRSCNETPFFMPAQKIGIAYTRYVPFIKFQCRSICFNQSEYFFRKIQLPRYTPLKNNKTHVKTISVTENKQNKKCLLKKAVNIC